MLCRASPRIIVWVSPSVMAHLLEVQLPLGEVEQQLLYRVTVRAQHVGEDLVPWKLFSWPRFSWPQVELVWGRWAHLPGSLVLSFARATSRCGWLQGRQMLGHREPFLHRSGGMLGGGWAMASISRAAPVCQALCQSLGGGEKDPETHPRSNETADSGPQSPQAHGWLWPGSGG